MLVLGLHAAMLSRSHEPRPSDGVPCHDATAVLVGDNELIAAIEEERLDRVKHSGFFPVRAIRACLEIAGVGLEQVDAVAMGCSANLIEAMAFGRTFTDPHSEVCSGAERVARLIAEGVGTPGVAPALASRMRFVGHHLAHAASAHYASGFEEALVLTLDGVGDGVSGSVYRTEGGQLRCLKEWRNDESLGHWYITMIRPLGYTRFDEYKVMGIAPYGDPERFAYQVRALYQLRPNGDYRLRPPHEILRRWRSMGLVAQFRRRGEPFSQVHKDWAAALQRGLEDIVLHVLRHYQQSTGLTRLSIAGGVAHNCSMNGRIYYSGVFERIFVQPAAHDAGTALGAAWHTLAQEAPSSGKTMPSLYLGRDVGAPEIDAELERWSRFISVEQPKSVCERTAELLVEGEVVGWVQGRSEFGPRALGNRSILADPRPATNKSRINGMVKKREGYRPFAPSVVEERLADFFEVRPDVAVLSHMIFVVEVRPEQRQTLAAVTHVDGTARVQSVSETDNPRYHALLTAFGERTGVPILLNTSFNNDREPIVDSVGDAITAYLTTSIDHLVVGDRIVGRSSAAADPVSYLQLVVGLRSAHVLVRRAQGEGVGWSYSIESTGGTRFGPTSVEVSLPVFQLLSACDGVRTAAELARAVVPDLELAAVAAELVALWDRRAVVLAPSGSSLLDACTSRR